MLPANLSCQSTDQAKSLPGPGWPANAASNGNRISMQHYVVLLLLLDVLTMAGAGYLVSEAAAHYGTPHYGTAHYGIFPFAAASDLGPRIWAPLFLFVLLAFRMDAYNSRCILDLRCSVARIIAALMATFLVLLTLDAATQAPQDHSQLWLLSWAAVVCAVLPAFRVAARARVRDELDNKGAFVFRALSVGVLADPLSREEISRRTGNQVKTVDGFRLDDFEALAGLSQRISQEDIDRVYVTVPWTGVPAAIQYLQVLSKFSVQVFVIPNSDWICSGKSERSALGDLLFLKVVDRRIDDWGLWFKRLQDIVVATAAIIFFAPVLLIVPLLIKLESRGPVIFRQKRVGLNGSIFELWKFRSMYVEHTDPAATVQTSKDDPRVTRVGRFIRRSSIDELPQFFNVLQGSMSVVGPRPHALDTRAEGQLLEELVQSYAARHRFKPGLTGWAQVNGLRGELYTAEKLRLRVEHDIEYIEKWSIWLDLKIIVRTFALIIYDPAAY